MGFPWPSGGGVNNLHSYIWRALGTIPVASGTPARVDGTSFLYTLPMIQPGSIVGLALAVHTAAVGDIQAQVTVNGGLGTLLALMVNPTGAPPPLVVTQGTGIDTFVQGDEIGVDIWTPSGISPTAVTNQVSLLLQI